MAKRLRLTTKLIRDLCGYIRGGAFEQVACEALGVPEELFRDWLARGQGRQARGLVRELACQVRQARALARVKPEMDMRTEQPQLWLLQGPGKETPDSPGWSAPPRSAGATAAPADRTDTELVDFIVALLQALRPFPDARAAVAPLAARFFPEVTEAK
jgi:hypothetical protein